MYNLCNLNNNSLHFLGAQHQAAGKKKHPYEDPIISDLAISSGIFVMQTSVSSLSLYPRDSITLSKDDGGIHSPPKRIVFRFHCHSQKVIPRDSLGPAKKNTVVHSGFHEGYISGSP